MEGKKIALVVGLFVIVIALVVIMGKRAGLFGGGPKPPQWVMEKPLSKIDVKTLKVVTLSIGQWEKLGRDASGRCKNPDTGEYTMAKIMICAACGVQIPALESSTPGASKRPHQRGDQDDAMMKMREEYKCPNCGKSPFPAGMLR